MKKYMVIVVFVVVAIFISITDNAYAEPLSWLQCEKTKIVNSQGERVRLRGVNLGSWLVQETWMLPFKTTPSKKGKFSEIRDHTMLWNTLERRFGYEKMHQLRLAFRKSWITEKDFAQIRAMGFNCVRLPFLYDMIDEPEGLFFWLDTALEYARKHGLYVILDMHGAPGRQSSGQHTGEINHDRFFSDPTYWTQAGKLWGKIAERYKDCPEIAGFDLLNEPKGAPSNAILYKAQHELYRRLRRYDKRHIIFVEDGYKSIKYMPKPDTYGWKNTALSTHIFSFEELSEDAFQKNLIRRLDTIADAYRLRKMPYFLGEFNVKPYGTFTMIRRFVSQLHQRGLSYCFWSYKIAHRGGGHLLWGLYSSDKHTKSIDPFKDSHKEILKKIQALTTDRLAANRPLIELFQSHLASTS